MLVMLNIHTLNLRDLELLFRIKFQTKLKQLRLIMLTKKVFNQLLKKNKRTKASFNVFGLLVNKNRNVRIPPHPGRKQVAHATNFTGTNKELTMSKRMKKEKKALRRKYWKEKKKWMVHLNKTL